MSHFTVMLKITPERLARHNGNVETAVAKMLAPFQENNMGDCPKEFLEFNDLEDEYREEYETEGTEMVRLADGSLAYSWDEQFRVQGQIGIGGGTHRVPDHLKKEHVPHKERFPTLEAYARDYHGSRGRDANKGRYGYWENPNKKWDWYQIGGRWSGFFPVKKSVTPTLGEMSLMRNDAPEVGKADVCRVGDLDMDRIAQETREGAEKFWARWEQYKRGETPIREKDGMPDPWFRHDVRGKALDRGILRVIRDDGSGNEKAPEGWATDTREWAKCDDSRRTWSDAISPIGRDEFMAEFIDSFCPVTAYAALDDDGWHAPGKMGWFGCSSDTPEEKSAHDKEFVRRFIKQASPDTTLVVVDCHI